MNLNVLSEDCKNTLIQIHIILLYSCREFRGTFDQQKIKTNTLKTLIEILRNGTESIWDVYEESFWIPIYKIDVIWCETDQNRNFKKYQNWDHWPLQPTFGQQNEISENHEIVCIKYQSDRF